MSYHIGLQVLRAKIRGFAATGETFTARIAKAQRERKNRLWDAKRSLGNHARLHLIAYGLLRGVPYEKIERCAPQNKPDPQRVLDIMLAHADWQQKRGLDLEKVKALLATSSSEASSTPTGDSPATPSPEQTPQSTLGKAVGTVRRLLEKRA